VRPAIAPGGRRRRPVRPALRAQDGSTLIEVIVAAALLLILALGVLQAIDHADARGAEQKAKSIAGNLAQSEQERLRALPLEDLSNNHSTRTTVVNGATFTIESRAEWVTDATGEANCATGGASADYMRITSTVTSTSLRKRTPVTLDSIMTPPARAFSSTEGSLSVQITDRRGDPVEGQALSLTGDMNVSGVTNDRGCVLWGYLPAANDYVLSYSSPGWINPAGATTISATQSVAGEQTRNVVFTYDRGGTLAADFVTTRMSDGARVPTEPAYATIENPGPPATLLPYALDHSHLATPLLFPFTSPYSVYADSCTKARPATPAVATILPGQTTTAAPILLPALDVKAVRGATAVSGATVSVITSCGTKIRRTTTASGRLTDPGYPAGTGFSLCVSDGTVKRDLTVSNATLPGQDLTVDLAGAPAGVCA
jgi:Tfp pilus assembly protein PilV